MFARRFFNHCTGLPCLASQSRRRASNLTVVMSSVMTISVLAGLVSCAAYRATSPGDPKLDADATQAHRVRVAGYTMSDGRYHRFYGSLTHRADSLVFVRPAAPAQFGAAASPERVLILAVDQVQSVRLQDGVSLPRSVLFGVSLLAFLALMWAASGGDNLIGPITPLVLN